MGAVTDRLRDLLDLIIESLDDRTADGEALARRAGFSRDHLDRIVVLTDTGQHLVELTAQPFTRDYLRHAGVPPLLRLVRTKRRLRPHYVSPVSGTGPRGGRWMRQPEEAAGRLRSSGTS